MISVCASPLPPPPLQWMQKDPGQGPWLLPRSLVQRMQPSLALALSRQRQQPEALHYAPHATAPSDALDGPSDEPQRQQVAQAPAAPSAGLEGAAGTISRLVKSRRKTAAAAASTAVVVGATIVVNGAASHVDLHQSMDTGAYRAVRHGRRHRLLQDGVIVMVGLPDAEAAHARLFVHLVRQLVKTMLLAS